MNLQVFQYQNSPITFNLEGEVMVNATQMAKPFGKKTSHFVENNQTQEYIRVLESKVGIPTLVTNHGGNNPGTWMHQKLALKFAGWLSPEFELWVYDRIEELLTTGKAELNPMTDTELLAKALQVAQRVTEQYKNQNLLLTQSIQQQAPMVSYYNEVLQTEGGQVTSVIAQDFGLSATTMNRKLKELGVIRKVGGAWVLCAKHQGKSYTITKTHTFQDSRGVSQTAIQLLWTQKGRAFLHALLKGN